MELLLKILASKFQVVMENNDETLLRVIFYWDTQ